MARSSTSFQPGQSGNPGGRPKAILEIRQRAQESAGDALERVLKIMRDDDHKQQLAAALAVLKVAGVSMGEDRTPNAPEASQQAQSTRDMTDEELLAAATKGEA